MSAGPHLLVAQVLAAQRFFQSLADLLPRDREEICRLEDRIDEVGVPLLLLVRHCKKRKARHLSAMDSHASDAFHDGLPAIVDVSPLLSLAAVTCS